VSKLPGTGAHGVVLGSQGTDGAKINDVSGKLRIEGLSSICADFRVVTTAGHAKSGNTGNLLGETNATSTVDTTSHNSLDNRANVLVLNRALDLTETRAIRTEFHRLILEITLTTLITNRAI
jgi:hypothetical protein